MQVTIDLDSETVQLLAALSPDGAGSAGNRALSVVRTLVYAAADGVRRPGAWERGWLVQCFGNEWVAGLETDPSASWRQRPRRGGVR